MQRILIKLIIMMMLVKMILPWLI